MSQPVAERKMLFVEDCLVSFSLPFIMVTGHEANPPRLPSLQVRYPTYQKHIQAELSSPQFSFPV
jgi:hypothetical protein